MIGMIVTWHSSSPGRSVEVYWFLFKRSRGQIISNYGTDAATKFKLRSYAALQQLCRFAFHYFGWVCISTVTFSVEILPHCEFVRLCLTTRCAYLHRLANKVDHFVFTHWTVAVHYPTLLYSTQPSITPGSVNDYQLRLGRQRRVRLIPIADECVGVQVKLKSFENTCRTWALLRWWFTTKRRYIKRTHLLQLNVQSDLVPTELQEQWVRKRTALQQRIVNELIEQWRIQTDTPCFCLLLFFFNTLGSKDREG